MSLFLFFVFCPLLTILAAATCAMSFLFASRPSGGALEEDRLLVLLLLLLLPLLVLPLLLSLARFLVANFDDDEDELLSVRESVITLRFLSAPVEVDLMPE